MTKEKKITISREDYNRAFAQAMQALSMQCSELDKITLMSVTVAIVRCSDGVWEILEEMCNDDE